MAAIIIGEKVINKVGAKGVIISFNDQYIEVDFQTRVAKLQLDAFEKGFLRYENADIQNEINEKNLQVKKEKEAIAEIRRLALKQANDACRKMESEAPPGVKFNSVRFRLEPAKVIFSSSRIKNTELIVEIFNECDKDSAVYYDYFHPKMKYVAPLRSYSDWTYLRSRYCSGILTKYLDTYVLRVFSRNDVYTPGMVGGFTVTNSDTTEILRIFGMDGEYFCFSKNFTHAGGNYRNTDGYDYWHQTQSFSAVNLDEVIRACDCKYLNDFIPQKDVNCRGYSKLLMAALYNNKAEIVFKNRLFSALDHIDNIADYLEEFSSKQIDFASKNNVVNTLSFIKRNGFYDSNVLLNVEALMKKDHGTRSIYDNLVLLFNQRQFDLSVLDRKLIGFLRKFDQAEPFNSVLYGDYVEQLIYYNDVTVDSIFAKDYPDRHFEMMKEQDVRCTPYENNMYINIAKELSWIDREENGYFIMVPKNIPEFKCEGQMQHNCVYTNRYYKDVISRRSIIVFLREEKNTSFVTIEYSYRTFMVRQAYKKFNQRVDTKLYKYIVDLGARLKAEMLAM